MSHFSSAKNNTAGEVSTCTFYVCPLLTATEVILLVHDFSLLDAFDHPVSLENKKMLPCPFYMWKNSDTGRLSG